MNGHHSWPRAVTHCRVRSMGGLRERGSLVRRDGDALGGSLDQLGHVLVVILANNMTARQALRLGDITLRLKQAICCDLFRSLVTNHSPSTLHLHPSSTSARHAHRAESHIIERCNFTIKSPHFLLRGRLGHGARGEGGCVVASPVPPTDSGGSGRLTHLIPRRFLMDICLESPGTPGAFFVSRQCSHGFRPLDDSGSVYAATGRR